jgi:hypothetical protein
MSPARFTFAPHLAQYNASAGKTASHIVHFATENPFSFHSKHKRRTVFTGTNAVGLKPAGFGPRIVPLCSDAH